MTTDDGRKKKFGSVIHVLCVLRFYQMIQPVKYTFIDHNHTYYLISCKLSSLLAIFRDAIQYYKKFSRLLVIYDYEKRNKYDVS